MKVFISWSGDVSRGIATKLHDWLPMVLQSVQPYMSAESIDKGTRWASSIANELDGSSVGVVVLTPDNLSAPWIYFESGALAKVVGDSKLAPLLCGLKPSDIGTPLSQFQVTVFNKDDVLKLLKSINACSGEDALPDARLEKMHGALWSDFSSEVEPIIARAAPKSEASEKKPENEISRILEEILVLSRQQSQALLSPDKLISRDLIRTIAEVMNDVGLEGPELERLRNIVRHLYLTWRDLNERLGLPPADDDEMREKEIAEARSHVDMVMRDLVETVEAKRRRSRRIRFDVDPFRIRSLLPDEDPK